MNPSQQFGNLFNAYAKAINKAYRRTGSLFENPFGRIPVTSDAYFGRLVAYIHQNPQKHRFVDDFRAWPYSSYQAFLSQQATHLKRDEVLAWFQEVPPLFKQATSSSSAHTALRRWCRMTLMDRPQVGRSSTG